MKKKEPSIKLDFSEDDQERIIRMAWEDRTPFDAIEAQFGLNKKETIAFMKKKLKVSRFISWKERVTSRAHLKDREERGFKVGVFKSKMQRLNGTIKRGK